MAHERLSSENMTRHPADEQPYIAEAIGLLETWKAVALSSFFLFVRYQNGYERYAAVQKYFPQFVELGLAGEDRKTTAKGRCLYRLLCVDIIEDVEKQIDAKGK